jgi:hypothetical protein
MNRMFTMLSVVALGLIAGIPIHAQNVAVPTDAPLDEASAVKAAVKHVLVATYFDEGDADVTLSKPKTTYTFGNVVTVTCTAACTLEVAAIVQMGGNKVANNLWSICADIDDKTDLVFCPYQGTLPTNQSYVIGSYIWSVSTPLGKGTHTVQPTAYLETGPANVVNYHYTYRLYQP